MAAINFVLFGFMALLAVSSAAPSDGTGGLPVPDKCRGKKGFCTIEPKGYKELQKKIADALPPFLKREFAHRQGNDSDDSWKPTIGPNDCPAIAQEQEAYQFISDNGTMVDTILQLDTYKQNVKTITCAFAKTPKGKQQCFRNMFDDSVSATCQQVYANRRLFVWTGSEVAMKKFKIPVCCSCVLKT